MLLVLASTFTPLSAEVPIRMHQIGQKSREPLSGPSRRDSPATIRQTLATTVVAQLPQGRFDVVVDADCGQQPVGAAFVDADSCLGRQVVAAPGGRSCIPRRRDRRGLRLDRIITGDIGRLVGLYEKATKVQATWCTEDFAEIRASSATLAIGSTRTVPLFAPGAAWSAGNHAVIVDFLVDDVDGVTRTWPGSPGMSSPSPPRCPGATGRRCCVTPTTSSLLSSRPPSRSSLADQILAARQVSPGRIPRDSLRSRSLG